MSLIKKCTIQHIQGVIRHATAPGLTATSVLGMF